MIDGASIFCQQHLEMPKLPQRSANPKTSSPGDVLRLLLRGSLLKAEAEASAILRMFPGNFEFHFAVGVALARQLMPRLALPHLQRASSRRPVTGDTLRIYGAALLDAGELDKARIVLNETVGSNFHDFLAHALLGRLHALLNDRSCAENHAEPNSRISYLISK
jgi:predicted Zn-dependent protease